VDGGGGPAHRGGGGPSIQLIVEEKVRPALDQLECLERV
jgi:hypothetical protein